MTATQLRQAAQALREPGVILGRAATLAVAVWLDAEADIVESLPALTQAVTIRVGAATYTVGSTADGEPDLRASSTPQALALVYLIAGPPIPRDETPR